MIKVSAPNRFKIEIRGGVLVINGWRINPTWRIQTAQNPLICSHLLLITQDTTPVDDQKYFDTNPVIKALVS